MKNINDDLTLVELEEEIGKMDFTGSLEKNGFSNDYTDFDETEDDLINEFLQEVETDSNDYLITY